MLCHLCQKNEATVHFTEIVEDKMQKVDLCEACSKDKGLAENTGSTLADLLLGLATSSHEVKCPGCGLTQADFKKSGRLGCAQCYQAFAEGLESLLKSMHKGIKHVGKVPVAAKQARESGDRLKTLERQMRKAIEEERFEQAAVLRDEINQLRAKTVGVTGASA